MRYFAIVSSFLLGGCSGVFEHIDYDSTPIRANLAGTECDRTIIGLDYNGYKIHAVAYAESNKPTKVDGVQFSRLLKF